MIKNCCPAGIAAGRKREIPQSPGGFYPAFFYFLVMSPFEKFTPRIRGRIIFSRESVAYLSDKGRHKLMKIQTATLPAFCFIHLFGRTQLSCSP
jgi:hypothetical protein